MGARMVEKQRRAMLKKLQKSQSKELLTPVDMKPSISRDSSETKVGSFAERERRKREFEIMRKIQKQAHTRRRWVSLLISGSVWLALWFVGAAVFRATEKNQNWTYFEALYFSYTSLLTIGYGDMYPMSNSGKPFFVFWSLLAIPSLTILISNMGDTIVKGIRDLTLWIGNFTVLPGEQGIKTALKQNIYKATRGRAFNSDIREQPMGILGETDRPGNNEKEDAQAHKNDPEGAAQRAAGHAAERETADAERAGHSNDEDAIPKSKRHYHCILIKEIGKVMRHLDSSPPRKYTFDEWAWYLKLIGEDESNAETHRKAPRKPKADGEGLASATDGEAKTKWSWVGNRSPLMGNKEEAEWVLERLTKKLEEELEEIRKEEMQFRREGHEAEDSSG
jgi:potassium channel subfamily K